MAWSSNLVRLAGRCWRAWAATGPAGLPNAYGKSLISLDQCARLSAGPGVVNALLIQDEDGGADEAERRALGESWYRQEYCCSFAALQGLASMRLTMSCGSMGWSDLDEQQFSRFFNVPKTSQAGILKHAGVAGSDLTRNASRRIDHRNPCAACSFAARSASMCCSATGGRGMDNSLGLVCMRFTPLSLIPVLSVSRTWGALRQTSK